MTVPYEELKMLTGANDRQIQWWCRDGLVPGQPRVVGSGNWRTYTRDDFRHIRVIRLLREARVAAESVGSVMESIRSADWSQPLNVQLGEHVTLTVDLPTIDAETPYYGEVR